MAFGAIDNEILIDNVGMLLLINYHKRLARSKMNESLLLLIIHSCTAEMELMSRIENPTKEITEPMAKRGSLLLSSCICYFEVLRENELLWNIEDNTSNSIVESLLNICKYCKLRSSRFRFRHPQSLRRRRELRI